MNILAIGAHHDDLELGCGGSIARLAAENHRVFGVILTDSETHYDLKGIHRTAEQAKTEAGKAASVLGLELAELDFPKAKNGLLTYDVELMRALENFIVKNKITQVFCHWRSDLNTDHAAAAQLTVVAARHVPKILAFRSNWYQPDRPFNGVHAIDISAHVDKKIKALEAYTVEIKNRSRDWIDSFIDRNRSDGFAFGVKYAEVFEVIRWVE